MGRVSSLNQVLYPRSLSGLGWMSKAGDNCHCVGGINAGPSGQRQCQHFRAGHVALVAHTGELPQGQMPLLIQEAACRSHASQRGGLASQGRQILGFFLAQLHRY